MKSDFLTKKEIQAATQKTAEEWLETKVKPRIQDNLNSGRGGLKSRTGTLKNAVTVSTKKRSDGGVDGFVNVSGKDTSKIARIWEITGHKEILPKAGRPYSSGEQFLQKDGTLSEALPASDPRARLRFRVGGPVSGRHVFARRVKAEGPRPFIRPAIEQEAESIKEIARRHYKEAIIKSLCGPR